jgi:hypothetical protein
MNSRNLAVSDEKSKTTFEIQEADLFFQKNITPSISALVNMQLTNNYSQEKSWGTFNMDEAWVKFSPYRALNIKVGKIVPMFNTFSQIKSKYPLIPYLLRPLIYESTISSLLDFGAWVPEHAFLQINGTIPISKVKLEYAVFGGNSEFTLNSKTSYYPSGFDTTNYKSGGGRIGIKALGVTLGISGSYDYTRNDAVNKTIASLPASLGLSKLGAVPRSRFGCDFNYSGFGITADFEYIFSKYYFSGDEKAKLSQIVAKTTDWRAAAGQGPMLSDDFTKTYFNANIMYDFLEKYYISIGYASIGDESSMLLFKDGLNQVMGGLGYHFNDNITFKAQVVDIYNDVPKGGVEVSTLYLLGGVSVYF